MVEMPQINREKCDECGLCVSVCDCGAILLVDNVITIVETEKCKWCTLCEVICPKNAIVCSFEIITE